MPHEITVPVKCSLCKKTFYGPTAALVGDADPTPRGVRFIRYLHEHIARDHPQVASDLMYFTNEFYGWRALSLFDTQDKKVLEVWDRYRWRIHQETLACRAQNLDVMARQIAKQVVPGYPPNKPGADYASVDRDRKAAAEIIQAALEELRDLLEEPNRYPPPEPPKPAEQPKIVTV
jgi:hypothetical protein